MTANRYDLVMAPADKPKLNPGEILQYMRFNFSDSTAFDFVNLGENQTAIIGKNGSGKTTYLRELAQSLLPNMFLEHNYKLWSGGFLFQPAGPRDGINPISTKGPHYSRTDSVQYNSGFGVDGKTSNDYISQDVVLPDRSILARRLLKNGILWEPKWDSGLEKEISNQNLFLKISHYWPQESFYNALSQPYLISDLILRVVRINEDTPNASQLRSSLINSLNQFAIEHSEPRKFTYINPNSEESREITIEADLDDFIHFAYMGKKEFSKISDSEIAQISIAEPLFNNPLATPFLFGTYFLNEEYEIVDMVKEIAINMPSTLIEWPRVRFQGPSSHLFSSAADVHLGVGLRKNDRDSLDASISTESSVRFNVEEFEHPSWGLGRKEIISKAAEILRIWDVVPTWESSFEINGEKHSSINGYEIGFHENNLSYSQGYADAPNETTRRWMLRALQIASMLTGESSSSPYKIAIWDEPELGLHPTAIENVKFKVFPHLAGNGIKLIFSTHSLVLASASQKVHKSEWKGSNLGKSCPVLTELPFVSEELLSEVGFTKSDLLASIETLLIVEGKHDKIVLESYFGEDFLGRERVRISTLDGANNLMLMPEAEILMDFLATRVVILTDGGNKSRLDGTNDESLRELNRYLSLNDRSGATAILNKLRSKVVNRSEGDKLLSLIDSIILRGKNDSKLLPRFSIHLLEKDDIIHYLNPEIVLAPYSGIREWPALIAEWKKNKILEKSRNVPYKDRMNEKTFYKKILGAKLSLTNVKAAADALLDVGPIVDFENLRTVLSRRSNG